MTIVEAALTVMQANGAPMSASEVYKAIVARGLFQFSAKDPTRVVETQLRRHCVGLSIPNSPKKKHFAKQGPRYAVLPASMADAS